MTILVFGQTGQVASELCAQGDVIALDRKAADLRNPTQCGQAIHDLKPSVVINAAAYTAVDAAEENEKEATLVNGVSPGVMAVAARNVGAPFLQISTDYVFDGQAGTAWKPSDATNPLNAYGRSKLAGELAVSKAGGQFVILRTSWVFSAHGNNFVKTMLRLADGRAELNVVADQTGGPTAAADIAAALLKIAAAIQDGNTNAGIYHIAGAPKTTWADFAREIIAQAEKDVSVVNISTDQFPTAALRPENSVLDCSVLLSDFAIPQPDWKTSLKSVLQELGDV